MRLRKTYNKIIIEASTQWDLDRAENALRGVLESYPEPSKNGLGRKYSLNRERGKLPAEIFKCNINRPIDVVNHGAVIQILRGIKFEPTKVGPEIELQGEMNGEKVKLYLSYYHYFKWRGRAILEYGGKKNSVKVPIPEIGDLCPQLKEDVYYNTFLQKWEQWQQRHFVP
jgi:hypothetical protein